MKSVLFATLFFGFFASAAPAPTYVKCHFGTGGAGPLFLEVQDQQMTTNVGSSQGLIVKVRPYSIPLKSIQQTSVTLKVVAGFDKNSVLHSPNSVTGKMDRVELTWGATNARYDRLVLKVNGSESNLHRLNCISR